MQSSVVPEIEPRELESTLVEARSHHSTNKKEERERERARQPAIKSDGQYCLREQQPGHRPRGARTFSRRSKNREKEQGKKGEALRRVARSILKPIT